jgi:hypothetical protein
MKQVAPLVIATLVAIGAALSSASLSPQFTRPSRSDALDIVEAVGDYEFRSIAAEYRIDTGPLMPDVAKARHLGIVDAAPCGESVEPVRCHPIEIDRQSEIGRLLLASWQDASQLLADRGRETPNRSRRFEESASPLSEHLLGLQIVASRSKGERITSSGLDDDMVRQRVKLRADTPPQVIRTYLAPWVVGDIAFVEVGLNCGDMCGKGTGYALQKERGKWRVIAVQDRWIV